MKVCSKCGEAKPLDQFYADRGKNASPDGRRADCKACFNATAKAWRESNRERVREADRDRYAADPQKHNRKVMLWHRENPHKKNAQQKAWRAVRSGKLARPDACEDCGDSRVEAHHDDYSKPLDVRWLCPICHRRADQLRQQREALA